mgnify:CR=1 FL=1
MMSMSPYSRYQGFQPGDKRTGALAPIENGTKKEKMGEMYASGIMTAAPTAPEPRPARVAILINAPAVENSPAPSAAAIRTVVPSSRNCTTVQTNKKPTRQQHHQQAQHC